MRRFIKPDCKGLPSYGHLDLIDMFIRGDINIRDVYRVYVVQCKAYNFYPFLFREWHNLNTTFKKVRK
jgi:hypothetical protein